MAMMVQVFSCVSLLIFIFLIRYWRMAVYLFIPHKVDEYKKYLYYNIL